MKTHKIIIIISLCSLFLIGCYSGGSGFYLESYKPLRRDIYKVIDKKDSIQLRSDLDSYSNDGYHNPICNLNNKYYFVYSITVFTPFYNKLPDISINSIVITIDNDTVPFVLYKEEIPRCNNTIIDTLPFCFPSKTKNTNNLCEYVTIGAEICTNKREEEIDKLCITYQVVIGNKIVSKKHDFRKCWFYESRPWGSISLIVK